MRPWAPQCERALGLNEDSCFITEAISRAGTLYLSAAFRMRVFVASSQAKSLRSSGAFNAPVEVVAVAAGATPVVVPMDCSSVLRGGEGASLLLIHQDIESIVGRRQRLPLS